MIPPIGKCEHGVPFDSECGECEEDAQIVKAGKERICKEKLDSSNTQIGGNHYKKLAIQPMTYSYVILRRND